MVADSQGLSKNFLADFLTLALRDNPSRPRRAGVQGAARDGRRRRNPAHRRVRLRRVAGTEAHTCASRRWCSARGFKSVHEHGTEFSEQVSSGLSRLIATRRPVARNCVFSRIPEVSTRMPAVRSLAETGTGVLRPHRSNPVVRVVADPQVRVGDRRCVQHRETAATTHHNPRFRASQSPLSRPRRGQPNGSPRTSAWLPRGPNFFFKFRPLRDAQTRQFARLRGSYQHLGALLQRAGSKLITAADMVLTPQRNVPVGSGAYVGACADGRGAPPSSMLLAYCSGDTEPSHQSMPGTSR